MEYYRRHLPHIHPQNAVFFITYRLVNSLQQWIIDQLKDEYETELNLRQIQKNAGVECIEVSEYHRRYFEKFDSFLDAQQAGNSWLADPSIAAVIAEAIHFRDGKRYDLVCYCIMPNHVHLVLEIFEKHKNGKIDRMPYLTRVLQSLKSYSATTSNVLLRREGQFWQRENYDHVIRNNQELERIIRYVIFNPVSAGLVKDWSEWKFTYCRYNLL